MTAIDEAFGTRAPAGERLDRADMRRRMKAIFIGSAGNLVEWYDFYAYSAFALYFAALVLSRPIRWCSSSTPPCCSQPASSCGRSADGCSAISPIITGGARR